MKSIKIDELATPLRVRAVAAQYFINHSPSNYVQVQGDNGYYTVFYRGKRDYDTAFCKCKLIAFNSAYDSLKAELLGLLLSKGLVIGLNGYAGSHLIPVLTRILSYSNIEHFKSIERMPSEMCMKYKIVVTGFRHDRALVVTVKTEQRSYDLTVGSKSLFDWA